MLILILDILILEQIALPIGFEEAGDVESFIDIDQKSDLAEQRDEDVDGELGFVLGVVTNHVLLGFLLKLSKAASGELRARTLLVREKTLPWLFSA